MKYRPNGTGVYFVYWNRDTNEATNGKGASDAALAGAFVVLAFTEDNGGCYNYIPMTALDMVNGTIYFGEYAMDRNGIPYFMD